MHTAAFDLAKHYGWDSEADELYRGWRLKATPQEGLAEGLRVALSKCRPPPAPSEVLARLRDHAKLEDDTELTLIPSEIRTLLMVLPEEGRREAEQAIVALLERENARCAKYLGGRHGDQDKAIQQGHYSESMNWTMDAIADGDHWT